MLQALITTGLRNRQSFLLPRLVRASSFSVANELRPFEDIPGPKGLPLIGNTLSLFLDPSVGNLLEQIPKRYEKYGNIFRMDLGPQKAIAICTPELVEEMFRQEGKYPVRETPPAWRKHPEDNGYKTGLHSEGEEWFHSRKQLTTKMLRPREIDAYVPKMNEIVTDFTELIDTLKDEQGVISDLRRELFGWSLEMMGTVALGTRLGAIGESKDPKCTNFTFSARETMRILLDPEILVYPDWLMKIYNTKKLKSLLKHQDVLLDFTKERLREKMNELENQENKPEGVDMMTYLLKKNTPFHEVISSIFVMLFGAVDTTSQSVLWALYCLASNPEKQDKLYKEITKCVEPHQIPSAEDINKLSYLKDFLKETQRVFPVAFAFVRKTTTEITLGGYRIPPNIWINIPTYFHAHHPDHFPDPESFLPERWSRGATVRPDPFTFTPFGLGNRSCLGRRVADMEMLLLLCRVCLKYRVQHVGEKPTAVVRGLLAPDKPIHMKFTSREVSLTG